MRKTRSKKEQSRKKIIILRTIFLRLSTFLILLGLVFVSAFIWRNLKKSVWDGKNNINFVIQADRTLIYSYHPNDEILNIISLPDNLRMPVIKDYGEYQLRNIYQLGEMEKIGGGELLKMSMQNFFNAPIDGWIIGPGNKDLEKGKLTSLYVCLLAGKCKTSFSLRDLLRIFSKTGSLKFNQISLVKIEETVLIRKENLADGSDILKLESSLVDDFSQRYFADKRILTEGLRINVINGTDYPGLAKKAGGLIKNIGGETISSEETDKIFEKTLVYFADEEWKKSYTLQKIKQLFQAEEVLLDEQIAADIKVILGKNYVNKHYLK